MRLIVNRQGVASFLKGPRTQALIERKTRAAEAAASAAAQADGWRGEFRTDLSTEGRRVRGAVIGDYSTPYPAVSRKALLAGLDAARAQD
ncbi:hypothetical protein ACLQ2N_08205 [Streptomyces sp. DT224]|uniref:hypothetical protein n=1 Tax=Streptomyces sp. DT224 TaxID=3393426 RepID=UPI003CFBAE98